MTRHGNSFYFEAEEEMALMAGVKRFKINATTTAYAHSQYGQIEAVGANAVTEIENPNCYGYPMSLGEAAQPTHILVMEWGTGNPNYWTDIETCYPANGS